MEFKIGDTIEYKGKQGKVTKLMEKKVGIQLDDESYKGDVMKTSVTKVAPQGSEKASTPAPAKTAEPITPATSPRLKKMATASMIGAVLGGVALGPVGAAAGAALGAAIGAKEEFQVGDAIEYKGKRGKVTKLTTAKVGIELDDESYKGDVMKTSVTKVAPQGGEKAKTTDPDATSASPRTSTSKGKGKADAPAQPAAAAPAASPRTSAKAKAKADPPAQPAVAADEASPRTTRTTAKGKAKADAPAKPAVAADEASPRTTAKGKAKASATGTTASRNLAKQLDAAAAEGVMPTVALSIHEEELADGSIETTKCNGPLFSDKKEPQPGEVHQGDLGDCYFAASLTLLSGYAPAAIRNAITEKKDAKGQRLFEVTFATFARRPAGKLPKEEARVTVTVDDTFYLLNVEEPETPELLYMNTGEGGKGTASLGGCIWPCVLEKAWAAFLAEVRSRRLALHPQPKERLTPAVEPADCPLYFRVIRQCFQLCMEIRSLSVNPSPVLMGRPRRLRRRMT